MKRHTVTAQEIDDWMNAEVWHHAASSAGNGSLKFLEISSARVFRVTDHGDIKYLGPDKVAAVQAYNDAH